MDDILIRGGQVIDGTGAPARVADVAIRAGRIVAIEADRAESAERVIDAHGSVVAPGFIDIHTHSDFTLPLNPRAAAKIRQGRACVSVMGYYREPPAPRGAARLAGPATNDPILPWSC